MAKVSDFGLSMSLYTSKEELKSGSSGLPVRWMAPEVLENRQVNIVSGQTLIHFN